MTCWGGASIESLIGPERGRFWQVERVPSTLPAGVRSVVFQEHRQGAAIGHA
jgi:hypothetical protein